MHPATKKQRFSAAAGHLESDALAVKAGEALFFCAFDLHEASFADDEHEPAVLQQAEFLADARGELREDALGVGGLCIFGVVPAVEAPFLAPFDLHEDAVLRDEDHLAVADGAEALEDVGHCFLWDFAWGWSDSGHEIASF